MDTTSTPATARHGQPDLGNRNFFWGWFAAVNAGLVATAVLIGPVALWAPVIGIGGAFASLFFAKPLAIRAHGIRLVNRHAPASGADAELLQIVTNLSERAGLPAVPAVGVYDSPDLNAFATGARQTDALVAFSSELVATMPPEHIRAVAAHELAHIANRDMIGMVMLQGIINAVVLAVIAPITLLRFANIFSSRFSWAFHFALLFLKVVVAGALTFLGSLVVKGYSRQREFRADATAARWVGAGPMAAALRALGVDQAAIPQAQLGYAALKIAGRSPYGEFFSTHPDLGCRIAALDALASPEPGGATTAPVATRA